MRKLSKIVHLLNPSNSLFGKIFVWFWLSVSTLLIVAFLLARLTRQPVEVAQASPQQLRQGQNIMELVQNGLDRGMQPQRALRRASNRARGQLMLVNIDTQELILGFPAPMLASKRPILALASSNQVLLVTTPALEFVGPFDVRAANVEYKLFAGRLLRRDERPPAPWGITLLVLLGLGSLLCVLLAWRLSKPLEELGSVSRAFADGDQHARVHNQDSRQDEIGQLAADFNRMADKLNASMQQQHLLMANVSHELRTPLTRLQLAAAMLQEKYGDDEYLSRIELEIATMDKLIGQILRLTRMQNANKKQRDQTQQHFESVNLNSLLSNTVENLQFEASAMGKQVNCEEFPDIVMSLNTDALISAIENLTRNAIKFANNTIFITNKVTETHLLLQVDDDGEGLPPEQLSKLFEAFYQAQNTPNVQMKGVGLGLAIAKAAVNMHDGELRVAPSTHGGLCFSITLPL